MLFLDLDRFKQINDSLGHAAGDLLLREVAGRLTSCLRAGDTVARLGGDEFVVLLTELPDERYAAAAAAKILVALAAPFPLAGQECRVTASIGISTYPSDGLDESALTKNADLAMYEAKAAGKNAFRFSSTEMIARSSDRFGLEADLRDALDQRRFELRYRVRPTGDGRPAVEALLRWQHPVRGLLDASAFVDLADETGLIVPIGRWMLRTACAQVVAWPSRSPSIADLVVPLTARQFHDERLVDDVATTLADTGIEPRLVVLEVHEAALTQDVERAADAIGALKALGVRIAIDDFGHGYAALWAAIDRPIDTLALDRSLCAVDGDDVATRRAAALTSLGRTFARTVAIDGDGANEGYGVVRPSAGAFLCSAAALAAEDIPAALQAGFVTTPRFEAASAVSEDGHRPSASVTASATL